MAIVGTFAYEEDFLAAAKQLQASGFDDISLLSPLPLEEAQEVLGLGKSPVRRFSLAGALIGATAGFAMTVATMINIGMLTERFIIVATSQPRKFLPDAFGFYFPSWIEISITIGSFGIFATLFLIFIKWVPAVSIYEVKETLKPLRRDA